MLGECAYSKGGTHLTFLAKRGALIRIFTVGIRCRT